MTTDWAGADLIGADLTGAGHLAWADLTGADLTGAGLRCADLRGANLQGANLTSATLRDADMRGANLGGADLTGANLTSATLWGADLRGAYVTCSVDKLHKVIIDAIQARIPGPVSEYDLDGIADEVARWDEATKRFRVHLHDIIATARRHEVLVQFDARDMHDLMHGTHPDTDPDTLAALWQQLGWQWAHTTAAAHPNRRVVVPPPPPDLAAQLWAERTQRPVWEYQP